MPDKLSKLFHSTSSLDEILHCVFSVIDAAVLVADKDRHIVFVNTAAKELFGYSEGELLGQSTQVLYLDSDSFFQQGERYFNRKASQSEGTDARLVHYKRKDGAAFIGETMGGPIEEGEKNTVFYLGIIKDVTRR